MKHFHDFHADCWDLSAKHRFNLKKKGFELKKHCFVNQLFILKLVAGDMSILQEIGL